MECEKGPFQSCFWSGVCRELLNFLQKVTVEIKLINVL